MARKPIRLVVAGVLGGGGLIALVGVVLFVKADQQRMARETDYSGNLIITESNRVDCKRYLLDNTTGTVRDYGIGSCRPVVTEPDSNRFSVISKAFRHE